MQDTGLIEGVTQAPQSTSYDAMVKRQGALAKKILKDADVVNLILVRWCRWEQHHFE